MRKSKPIEKKATKKYPERASEVPVTQAMLYLVRDELKDQIKSEAHGLRSEIHKFRSEIHGIRSDIHGIQSNIDGLKSEIHRIALLMEEQNARNNIVLDGLTGLFIRQDRVEIKVGEFEKLLTGTK